MFCLPVKTSCLPGETVTGTPVNITVYNLGFKNVLIFTEFLYIPFISIKFPSIN